MVQPQSTRRAQGERRSLPQGGCSTCVRVRQALVELDRHGSVSFLAMHSVKWVRVSRLLLLTECMASRMLGHRAGVTQR